MSSVQPPLDNTFIKVLCCFFLSGFAGLIYQTAWVRQISVVFGTAEIAVAAVLAAYMGGLALGAAIAGRLINKIDRPILTYGILEGVIAIGALSVPLLLQLASFAYLSAMGGNADLPSSDNTTQWAFYVIATFLVLLVPTACMGATLPLLARYAVEHNDQIGPRTGLLYAINTAGAVVGTLTAAFVLLPNMGLTSTIWVGVAVNFVVFGIAVLITLNSSSGRVDQKSGDKTEPSNRDGSNRRNIFILPVMLFSGVATFTYEVLWTRLLAQILGGSITAFATMLASFLAGIALGSAIASRFSSDRASATNAFVLCQLGIGVCSLAVYHSLGWVVPESTGLYQNAGIALLVMLPSTLFIGATFPLAVRILADSKQQAASATARVYSWNTVGSIIGALLAGFILIPLVRYEGAIQAAVCVNLALALTVGMNCRKTSRQKLLARGIPATALVLMMLVYTPIWPEAILRSSPLNDAPGGKVHYYDVGRSATVLMLERDGYLNLRTNGLPEASARVKGAPPSINTQRLLSTLPSIARPNVKTMLIAGLGGGVALESIPPTIESVDVVELEPKVLEANQSVSGLREDNPLDDTRVRIHINDARNALALTSRKWDAIVSQPSHPWTAGASHLYTKEYMTSTRKHLNKNGVFLQWMNLTYTSEELFKSLCRTLAEVYPYVRLYQFNPSVVFFLASMMPLEIERDVLNTENPFTPDLNFYRREGIASVEDLLSGLVMDNAAVRTYAAGAELISDDNNILATRSGHQLSNGLEYARFKEIIAENSPLFDTQSWIYNTKATINFPYIAGRLKRLNANELGEFLVKELNSIQHPQALSTAAVTGNNQPARKIELLLTALQQNPNDQQAKFLLMEQYVDEANSDRLPEKIAPHYTGMIPSAAAVIKALFASAAGNYSVAKALEDDLAQAKHTDAWHRSALKLRLDWRIRETSISPDSTLTEEALALIDTAISVYQSIDYYGMRSALTYLAGDYHSAVETWARMLFMINTRFDQYLKEDGSIEASRRTWFQVLTSMREGLLQTTNQTDELAEKTSQMLIDVDTLIEKVRSAA